MVLRAGVVTSSIKVKVLGDTGDKSDESMHATITGVSGASLSPDPTGTVTIVDDGAHRADDRHLDG